MRWNINLDFSNNKSWKNILSQYEIVLHVIFKVA